MGANKRKATVQITPIRLHLELKGKHLSDYEKRMLKRYGESSTGDSITRDILIPSDMPLHNLHYAIQKLFGWQNSHLRAFTLPKDVYSQLTGDTVKGWSELVGILFQPPSEFNKDLFWDDDYKKGNINTWLKKKYTGPYFYGGKLEHPEEAQKDVQHLLERFPMIEVRESFTDFYERSRKDNDKEIKILRKAPLIDLTLEEMNSSLYMETSTEYLLERIVINDILAAHDEKVDLNTYKPVTNKLFYHYDFGDNWVVTITKYKDCDDLFEQNFIDEMELEEAEETVLMEYKPVCIHKDGLSVLDNVGGLSGFANFLGTIYESDDKEEKGNLLAWAKSLGWSSKKMAPKMML